MGGAAWGGVSGGGRGKGGRQGLLPFPPRGPAGEEDPGRPVRASAPRVLRTRSPSQLFLPYSVCVCLGGGGLCSRPLSPAPKTGPRVKSSAGRGRPRASPHCQGRLPPSSPPPATPFSKAIPPPRLLPPPSPRTTSERPPLRRSQAAQGLAALPASLDRRPSRRPRPGPPKAGRGTFEETPRPPPPPPRGLSRPSRILAGDQSPRPAPRPGTLQVKTAPPPPARLPAPAEAPRASRGPTSERPPMRHRERHARPRKPRNPGRGGAPRPRRSAPGTPQDPPPPGWRGKLSASPGLVKGGAQPERPPPRRGWMAAPFPPPWHRWPPAMPGRGGGCPGTQQAAQAGSPPASPPARPGVLEGPAGPARGAPSYLRVGGAAAASVWWQPKMESSRPAIHARSCLARGASPRLSSALRLRRPLARSLLQPSLAAAAAAAASAASLSDIIARRLRAGAAQPRTQLRARSAQQRPARPLSCPGPGQAGRLRHAPRRPSPSPALPPAGRASERVQSLAERAGPARKDAGDGPAAGLSARRPSPSQATELAPERRTVPAHESVPG